MLYLSTQPSEDSPLGSSGCSIFKWQLTMRKRLTARPSSWIGWKRRPWSVGLFSRTRSLKDFPATCCTESAQKKTSDVSSASALNTFSYLSPAEGSPGSSGCSPGYPLTGSMRNGKVYQRVRRAPQCSEDVSTFWPSPQPEDGHGYTKVRGGKLGGSMSLLDAVRVWQGSPKIGPIDTCRFINPIFVEALLGLPQGWSVPRPYAP